MLPATFSLVILVNIIGRLIPALWKELEMEHMSCEAFHNVSDLIVDVLDILLTGSTERGFVEQLVEKILDSDDGAGVLLQMVLKKRSSEQ